MKLAEEIANKSKASLLLKMKDEIIKINGTLLDRAIKGRSFMTYAIDGDLPIKYRDRIREYFETEGFVVSTYSNSITLSWEKLMDEKCAQCGKDHFDAACQLNND